MYSALTVNPERELGLGKPSDGRVELLKVRIKHSFKEKMFSLSHWVVMSQLFLSLRHQRNFLFQKENRGTGGAEGEEIMACSFKDTPVSV